MLQFTDQKQPAFFRACSPELFFEAEASNQCVASLISATPSLCEFQKICATSALENERYGIFG